MMVKIAENRLILMKWLKLRQQLPEIYYYYFFYLKYACHDRICTYAPKIM